MEYNRRGVKSSIYLDFLEERGLIWIREDFDAGADERNRTSTGLPPLEPESSASTNSATSAFDAEISQKISPSL